MAINFPNSPSVNDIHVSGANRWQWNGSSWTRIGGAITDAVNSTNDNSTTTLYPVMVTGTGSQTAKIATTATKNISFDASDGNLTVGGNISVGGTITYEDVTNIDSVGVVTARAGVKITGGDLTVGTAATISSVGNITAGIVTAASGQLISGVGIDTGGTVIGYAATMIHFRGPGVSTAYFSPTTGVGTVYFQGGGGSASVSISESAPSSPSAGDMWWDSDVGNLQIYYTDSNSSQWVTANNSGPQGPQGAQGAAGAQGAQGYQGVQGSVGIASLTISTGAPSSPAAGDMWWDSDDGDLHLYYNDGNSSQWININAGSAGAQGVQGSTGAQGHQGRQGAGGSTGAQGAQGATGAQGVQGASGITTAISAGNSSIRFDGNHDIRFISNNNTRMYLDSDKFLVGAQSTWSHKAHYGDNNWSSDKFWVASTGGASQVASFGLGGNNAMPCEVAIQKTRGTLGGSLSALQLSDPLGALQFNGSPDNNMRQAATFACYVDSSGTISNSSLPTNLRFYTNPNGAVIPTEKLRITSDGMLEMRSNMSASDQASRNIFRFTDTDSATGANQSMGRLQWFSSDSSGGGACVKAEIESLASDTTPDAYMVFKTHEGSGTTPTERLRITSAGKVGIGTVTPGFKLDVDYTNNAEDGIRILNRASGSSSTSMLRLGNDENINAAFLMLNSSGYGSVGGAYNLVLGHGLSRDIVFATGGAERLRIDSSGRLRVASTTESADSAFDDLIVGNHSGNRGISILSTNGQQGALGFAKSGTLADGYVAYVHNSTATSSAMTIKSSGHIQFNAGSSEKVRITSAGLVGIGIATPDSLLHLEGSGSTAKIKLQRTGTTIGGSINTRDESGDKGLTYLAKDGNSGVPAHVFQTDAGSGAVERLRIASNGDIESANSVQSGGNATSGFKIGSADTAAYMSVQSKSVANGGSTSNAAFQAWLGSSNTFRVNANGLIKTSAGVDFSGAQTNYSGMSSEVLDSYEEGTFTPSINGMGSISYSVQAGKYTKIGNTVFFQIRFNLSSRTAGSHAHITNMPFTASTATIQYAQCTVYAIQGLHCSSNHHPIGQFQSSEIYLYQVGYQSSSNYSNIDENQISGTAQFGVYGFYYTAS